MTCNKIKKSFFNGFCYPCYISSPEASPCILRPELCEAHEKGRDVDWESSSSFSTPYRLSFLHISCQSRRDTCHSIYNALDRLRRLSGDCLCRNASSPISRPYRTSHRHLPIRQNTLVKNAYSYGI